MKKHNKISLFKSSLARNVLLCAGDMLCLSISTLIGLYIYRMIIFSLYGNYYPMSVALSCHPILSSFFVMALFARLYGANFVYGGVGVEPVEELKRLTLITLASFIFFIASQTLFRDDYLISRSALAIAVVIAAVTLPLYRYVARKIMSKLRIGVIPVVVAGGGALGKSVMYYLSHECFYGFEIAGFFDDAPESEVSGKFKYLGKLNDVVRVSRLHNVNTLISCIPYSAFNSRYRRWNDVFMHHIIVADSGVLPISWSQLVNMNGTSAVEINNKLKQTLFRLSKLFIEVILCSMATCLLIIPALVIAVLVKLTSRGPILYFARRLGQNGKEFYCLKFRTMYKDADVKLKQLLAQNPELKKEWDANFKLENDPRITPFGNFLRKTSLDEIPQLINVVRGEMSLIGPRPIVSKEKKYYGKYYRMVSRVKPGITGMWQVSGRSDTTYDERVRLDRYYILNWSIWLDYYIFLKTIQTVLFCKGAK